MLTRQELIASAQRIAPELDEALEAIHGERVGFTVFLFELGSENGSNIAFISNARRDDMVTVLLEFMARQEVGIDSDPLGPKAKS